jgi:hypothetical protein
MSANANNTPKFLTYEDFFCKFGKVNVFIINQKSAAMKRLFTYLTFIISLSLFMAGTSYAQQWANNGNHIYNTNIGNVGISNGAL